MFALLFIAGLFAASIAYELTGAYRDSRRFPPPGRLIDVGGCSMHLNNQGRGQPAVILESGVAATSLSWTLVQPEVARFTSVCSYDRAGLGWSGRSIKPRTVAQMVSELDELLSRARIPPPYVLVGHSFGGLLIRAYANTHVDKVAGLLFVDPVSLEYWANCSRYDKLRLTVAAKLARRGALLARIGVVRLALGSLASGQRRFPKLMAQAAAHQALEVLEHLAGEVRKLPREVWPIVRAHWSRSKCIYALAEYLESVPQSAETAISMPLPPRIPLTILSAATATAHEIEERDRWVEQSAHGRHVHVDKAGHWLQFERPDIVIAAIRELVDLVRSCRDATITRKYGSL